MIHCVRWLSREIVIGQILDSILVILAALHQESEAGDETASYLCARIANVFFILYLCMIYDLLVIIGKVSRYCQNNNNHLAGFAKKFEDCKSLIKRYNDPQIGGPALRKHIRDIKLGKYSDHGMDRNAVDETVISWLSKRGIEMTDAIDDEYKGRFNDIDMKLCKLFDIFDPQHRRKNISDNDYGQRQLKILSKKCSRKERVIKEQDSLHEWDELLLEMDGKLKHNPNLTQNQFWSEYLIAFDDGDTTYRNILLIYEASRIQGDNSSNCERSFHWLNQTKTALRNNLKMDTIDKLIFIKKNGWKD